MRRNLTFYHNYNDGSTQKMFKVEACTYFKEEKLVFVGVIDKLNVRDIF